MNRDRRTILGLKARHEFGLIPAVNAVYSSEQDSPRWRFHTFQGTGCVKRQYKMALRLDAIPVVQPAGKLPWAIKEPLCEELNHMERAPIIMKVDEPTERVSPFLFAVRKKYSRRRICMDPRAINKSNS